MLCPKWGFRSPKGSKEPTELAAAGSLGKDDARDNAVKLKLFGSLTRERHEWHPHSLLCKRFDVPDPFPKSGLVVRQLPHLFWTISYLLH